MHREELTSFGSHQQSSCCYRCPEASCCCPQWQKWSAKEVVGEESVPLPGVASRWEQCQSCCCCRILWWVRGTVRGHLAVQWWHHWQDSGKWEGCLYSTAISRFIIKSLKLEKTSAITECNRSPPHHVHGPCSSGPHIHISLIPPGSVISLGQPVPIILKPDIQTE